MSNETKFKLTRNNLKEVELIYLNGYLDAHTAPYLENAIAEIIAEQKFKLVVDFTELDYISSAGLGVFMVFIEEIRENGGDIKLCSMSSKVFSVFDLLGFPMLFDICDNIDSAIEKF